MITQRYLLLRELQLQAPTIGWLACLPAKPWEKFILWKGQLPQEAVPTHRSLGLPLSEGFIEGERYWIERCDAVTILSDIADDLQESDWRALLLELGATLQFLHQQNLAHGSIDHDHIGIRKDGLPVLLGVGTYPGTQEKDQQAFHQIWSAHCRSLPPDNFQELQPQQQLYKPPDSHEQPLSEVLFEVIHHAQKSHYDRIEYDETGTQHTEPPEITRTGEQTNSSPKLASKTTASQAEAMGALLSWLSQKAPHIHLTKPPETEKYDDLLLPLDPLPNWQAPELSLSDTPHEGESTEIIRQLPFPPRSQRRNKYAYLYKAKIWLIALPIAAVLFFTLRYFFSG